MKSSLIVVGLVGLTTTAHSAPHEFAADVRPLFDGAACADPSAQPAHCKLVTAQLATWRTKFRDKAAPFFAREAATTETTVVYPFGGGDLVTALVVYPDATDYTTLSLEGIGDPRVPVTAARLAKLRDTLTVTLAWAWNTTIQLSIDSSESARGDQLPAVLVASLVGLVANGYEPLTVRYFSLADDGAVRYVDDDALAAWDREHHAAGHKQTNSVQQGLFDDVEITFRAARDANAPVKTWRHVTADLSDDALAAHPGALAYLKTKPHVAAMTKAASYLLWKPTFSSIRGYLLQHAAQVVSDDTGVPPSLAPDWTYKVWGVYRGAHFEFADAATAKELVALWRSAANQGAIDFRFGYYDNADHPHVMISKKP
nr:hypothetical protein [Kofleriaceae bacterium]